MVDDGLAQLGAVASLGLNIALELTGFAGEILGGLGAWVVTLFEACGIPIDELAQKFMDFTVNTVIGGIVGFVLKPIINSDLISTTPSFLVNANFDLLNTKIYYFVLSNKKVD